MGAFREIGYGVLFFISAMLGAGVGAIIWSGGGHTWHQKQAMAWIVEGAVAGAIAGSALWLWAKYQPGRYGYAAMLALSALAGASIATLAKNSTEPDLLPILGSIIGCVLWLIFSSRFIPPNG